MISEEEKLIEAIERVRRDKHQPWHYIMFTFLNGIAYGLGVALGMTIILGLTIFLLTKVLSSLINFPVVGYYVSELTKMLDTYIKHGPKIR
ncbi:MAG: DUF5665 domain-containing protein [bacterium]